MLRRKTLSEAEEVGILCALPTSSRLLLKNLRALLQPKSERRKIKFLRAVLAHRKDVALALVDKSGEFFEITAFRKLVDLQATRSKEELLFQRILLGEFKSPLAWARLAVQLPVDQVGQPVERTGFALPPCPQERRDIPFHFSWCPSFDP